MIQLNGKKLSSDRNVRQLLLDIVSIKMYVLLNIE